MDEEISTLFLLQNGTGVCNQTEMPSNSNGKNTVNT